MKKRSLPLLFITAALLLLLHSASAEPLPAPPGGNPGVRQPLDAGPEAGSTPPEVRDLWVEQAVSYTSIFFPYSGGEDGNVYNADVAANYINGAVVAPGQEFSFNRVVGERTAQRGFMLGKNIWGGPDLGSGICRTSAGLKIVERHPHSIPVRYAPPGADATVIWGCEDLRFKNSGQNPITVYTRLEEAAGGRLLWAQFRERKPLHWVDVAVLKEAPGACLWEGVEKKRLTALVKDGATFISSGQLADLLSTSFHTELQGTTLSVSVLINGRLATFQEGSRKATVNGSPVDLSQAPFRLPSGSSKFWLPLRDWTMLTGAEALWIERPQPLVLLNLSGARVAGREELDPGWTVTGKAKPYGYRELKRDLNVLGRLYPQITVASIGRSATGQDIPVVSLGGGPSEIFVSGAWHGDEYITAAFLARFIVEACRNPGDPGWASLLSRATLYIAPMINPDGCEIAAHGSGLPPSLEEVVAEISPSGFDLSRWRANSQGIDLNSQFPARWEVSRDRLQHNVPPRGRAGEEPLSAPESRAVYDFTLKHNFAAVFCYHSQGEVIFWQPLDGNII